MTQLAKVINLTETFVPVDPQAFPENMGFTGKEDYPNRSAPIVAYEGYNFMPTSYGYKSYFGQSSVLDIDALPSKCDEIFILQTNTFENVLVALCADGIWTKRGAASGAWTHEITLADPGDAAHKNWSYTVINNTLVVYRPGEATYWKFDGSTNTGTDLGAVPEITMYLYPSYYVGGPLPATTYTYKVAVKRANGQLSAQPVGSNFVFTGAGIMVLQCERVADADNGYRVYRTAASAPGVVQYRDVAQSSVGVRMYLTDDNTGWTTVTLPDTTVSYAKYPPFSAYPVTPSFLNMSGQTGVFRAGGRLGFWDSAGSIGWSSLDDYADYTPSLTTLAGSAIFEDVQGSIVTIKSHGEGFIIYATKSIVYVAQNIEATFMWNPAPILSNAGISYPCEVTSSSPDNKHFASTSIGLIKIENSKHEVIVPEITDFLKESNDPIFLKLLEGRYLALQMLDPKYINGLVEFNTNTIEPTVLTIPGSLPSVSDLIPDITVTGTDICYATSVMTSGATQEHQAAGEAAREAAGGPAKAPGTLYTPVYTAYLSKSGGFDPDNIVWGQTPCPTVDPNGVPILMCPTGDAGKTTQLSSNSSHKVAVTGDEAYAGGWTIERFVQVQSAIWGEEERTRAAFVSAIVNRAGMGTKNSVVTTLPVNSEVRDECNLGTYVTKADPGYKFGWSNCSFWLTRYITQAKQITRVKTNRVVGSVKDQPLYQAFPDTPIPCPQLPDKAAAASAGFAVNLGYRNAHPELETGNATNFVPLYTTLGAGLLFSWAYTHTLPATPGATYTVTGTSSLVLLPGTYNKIESMTAYNSAKDVDIGVIVDTGFCSITGWKYTDINGVERTSPATVCPPPNPPATNDSNTGAGDSANNVPMLNPLASDGTFCSIPFEPVTITAVQPTPIEWPDQTVTYPGGSFLLQNGSIGPVYPTFVGALVYDLQLKKWGKLKSDYKQLLDYSPINSSAGAIINADVFGIRAGALSTLGKISLFDDLPTDSYIKYGKIGYYRLGMTTMEEVRVDFRKPSTGVLTIETSLDGRSPEALLGEIEVFSDELTHTLKGDTTGRWHSIKISGNYDITHLEFRGVVTGRR